MLGRDRNMGSISERLALIKGLLRGSWALSEEEALASRKGREPLEHQLDPCLGFRPLGPSASFLRSRRERLYWRTAPSQGSVPNIGSGPLGRLPHPRDALLCCRGRAAAFLVSTSMRGRFACGLAVADAPSLAVYGGGSDPDSQAALSLGTSEIVLGDAEGGRRCVREVRCGGLQRWRSRQWS